ncbi:SRPBCC family protein [Nonomuraea sediminis]|uniref:SRPBCC family protein n=1 Tax=Nonomuraea sediminis TaxID=2835864 RepID=UPI001BDC6CC9|nr:SRPBCC family protein [Nonomuraea sediminis]
MNAPVVVSLDIVIDAPLERVWQLHTDVNAWPSWQSDITSASAEGPLVPGAVFHWSTFGLDIASTVQEVEPGVRILWGGPAHGITGLHLWTFREEDGVVHVHTEESWDGEPVRADVEGMQAALEASLTSWLARLKETAEMS